ncbi:MAG: hypothetical protein GY839_06800 [candidate division Zixibacteria bacterium]|nr:hypothetical protein [candidate division Zixibacteria bacterium]
MAQKKKIIGVYIIASAIIWGAAMIGCSLMLKGTECFSKIATILGTAAGIHLIFIWGPLAAQLKKLNVEE